jgi:uncharacterized protein (TIGR04551 family)
MIRIRGSLALALSLGIASWPASALAQAAEPKPAREPGKAAPPPPTPPAAPKAPKGADVPKPGDAPKAGDSPKGAEAPKAGESPKGAAPPSGAKPTEVAPNGAETEPAAPPTGGSDEPRAAERPTTTPSAAPAVEAPGARPRAPIGIFPRSQPEFGATSPESRQRQPEQKASPDVFSEDWWSHARPVFEIHGYFRTRGELFHNFSLGRIENPTTAVWAQPTDHVYTLPTGETMGPGLCTLDEVGGNKEADNPAVALFNCQNKTQTGANMRFRLDPELHVSDNLRVVSQIDLLDNVVMGSTPSGYSFQPAAGGGYQANQRIGYYSNGVFDDTIVPPTSGVNSLSDSIRVKRVWAEYATPIGALRFGRMPDHFGLGMMHHSGDGYDDDYQSTIDRVQFITAIKPLDLHIGGSWDFPNEGYLIPPKIPGGQAHDSAQLDDVNQWSFLIMRRQSPELVKMALAHDQVVVNGGAYITLRKQLLSNDRGGTTQGTAGTAASGGNVPNATPGDVAGGNGQGFARVGANIWSPDLWLQVRYKKFRFEAEGAAVLGSLENTVTDAGPTAAGTFTASGRKIRQFGITTQLEQRLVEEKLRLAFNFGWSSGDPDAYNGPGSTNNLVPLPGQVQINDDTISTFRFHPAYRVDLILNRSILQRIQGTYYLKPSVEYDFMRKPTGQRLGGGAGIIWTRASEFAQTPGHSRDLGIELNGRLYFQSKDGSLNDQPEKKGGFYAMLEYGVLFPLAGMGYLPLEQVRRQGSDVSAAQILRLFLGVLF